MPPPSPHLPPPPTHTSPHIHGAAPPRLSHPTAPPDPRQPYPTRSLTAQPHPTRSPTAQPHPTPYHGTHGDRSVATVPVPPAPPLPRKGPPCSNRAAPREAWGLPQSASSDAGRSSRTSLLRCHTCPALPPRQDTTPHPSLGLCSCSAGCILSAAVWSPPRVPSWVLGDVSLRCKRTNPCKKSALCRGGARERAEQKRKQLAVPRGINGVETGTSRNRFCIELRVACSGALGMGCYCVYLFPHGEGVVLYLWGITRFL